MKNHARLRRRFLKYVEKNWVLNDHNLKEISCIYVLTSYNFLSDKQPDIEYVGSTTNLSFRYRSHKIPAKIQSSGNMNILYFLPMDRGFYDYEMKLIRKLKPPYNRQHKNGT